MKKELDIQFGNATLKVYFNGYTNEKNPKLRGFANVNVIVNEKVTEMYNAFEVVEHEGTVFIAEPKQKAYTNKDGETKQQPYFLAPRALKETVATEIKKAIQA